MMFGDWDCPTELTVGQDVEVYDTGSGVVGVFRVVSVYAPVVYLADKNGVYKTIDTSRAFYTGMRWRAVAATDPRIAVAPAVAVGHNCARCNDFNPDAIANKPDGKTFVCRSCQHDGWSRSWGPRFECP